MTEAKLCLVRRIRAWAGRHPQLGDAGLAALLAVVGALSATGVGGVGGWLWLGVLHLPLVWRRRVPVVGFWSVLGLSVVSYLTGVDSAYPLLATLAAIYALARYRPQRVLWPAVAVAEVLVVASWQLGGLQGEDLVAMTAVLAAVVLLGVTVSTRRAHLAELEERARRLERERDQQAGLAVAAERTRIAREMHDIVTHNLAVMVALADGAAFTAAASPQRAADAMTTVSTTGREALGDMRRLLGLLRDGAPQPDPALAPQPDLDDLDGLVNQVRAAGVQVELRREGDPGPWGPGAGLAVYRIVQEALTNTLRHAGPHATAQVRLCSTRDGVDLEVVDDGGGRPAVPLPDDGRAAGHGLTGMLERAAAYDGHVEAGPLPDTGWRVRAALRFADVEGAM